jgi:hypothetical protein
MKNNKPKSLPRDLDDLRKELDLMHSQFDYSIDKSKGSITVEPNIIELINDKSKKYSAQNLKKHLDLALKEYKRKLKLG